MAASQTEQVKKLPSNWIRELRCLLAALLMVLFCLYSKDPANSFPLKYDHFEPPKIAHARTSALAFYFLTCNPSSQKALSRHYATHPILKTAPGQRFNGSLSRRDWDELGALSFDANYIGHARAECDAAEKLCTLARAGEIDLDFPQTQGPHEFHITLGFNRIHVKLQMAGKSCVGATIQPSDEYCHQLSPPYGANHIFRHPILELAEFEQLGKRALTDEELRLMTAEQGYATLAESNYIHGWHCFRTAESESAFQFRDRLIGRTKAEIEKLVGPPRVKTGPVKVWGDPESGISNWIYYLGYEGIPVRLVMAEGRCVSACVLSEKQSQNLTGELIRRFSNPKPGLTKEEIARQGCRNGGPRGKTLSQILEIYGEPQAITIDKQARPVYVYGIGRTIQVEIPITDGKVAGGVMMLGQVGFTQQTMSKRLIRL